MSLLEDQGHTSETTSPGITELLSEDLLNPETIRNIEDACVQRIADLGIPNITHTPIVSNNFGIVGHISAPSTQMQALILEHNNALKGSL